MTLLYPVKIATMCYFVCVEFVGFLIAISVNEKLSVLNVYDVVLLCIEHLVSGDHVMGDTMNPVVESRIPIFTNGKSSIERVEEWIISNHESIPFETSRRQEVPV